MNSVTTSTAHTMKLSTTSGINYEMSTSLYSGRATQAKDSFQRVANWEDQPIGYPCTKRSDEHELPPRSDVHSLQDPARNLEAAVSGAGQI